MYISFLDYLVEIKKRYYIVISVVLFFLVLSFAFKFYKNDYYTLSGEVSLLKLTSLSLDNVNLRTDSEIGIKWIGNEAEKKYQAINKYELLKLKCGGEDYYLNCQISGRFKGNLDEVKKNMYKSITQAQKDYKVYFVGLIDGLISSKEDMVEYVEEAEDTSIDAKAGYKSILDDTKFAKIIFTTTLDEAKIKLKDIDVRKHTQEVNYILVIISGLVSSLFLIFLQMKSDDKDV